LAIEGNMDISFKNADVLGSRAPVSPLGSISPPSVSRARRVMGMPTGMRTRLTSNVGSPLVGQSLI